MPLQDDVKGLSPEQRQRAIRVIQSELQSRGKIPPTFGQRVGRGFQAGIRALPSIVGVKTPKEEKITPFERTLQTLSARRLFEKPKEPKEERPGKAIKDLKDSAELKIIQGGTIGDLTEEEQKAVGSERIAKLTPIARSPEFEEARGIPALTSPTKARITPEIQFAIDQIKTEDDLNSFIADWRKGEIPDNIFNSVMEFFGRPRR